MKIKGKKGKTEKEPKKERWMKIKEINNER